MDCTQTPGALSAEPEPIAPLVGASQVLQLRYVRRSDLDAYELAQEPRRWWGVSARRMDCPLCGKVLLSNAIPADTDDLILIHPACWRALAYDIQGQRFGVTYDIDDELMMAAAELEIAL